LSSGGRSLACGFCPIQLENCPSPDPIPHGVRVGHGVGHDFRHVHRLIVLLGLEALHMADSDVLPYDYELYGKENESYIEQAQDKAKKMLGASAPDFSKASQAAKRFEEAGSKILSIQKNPPQDASRLNQALIEAERALLLNKGLPNRPWFRHSIYAPGQYTGYAAVVIPGVNESIDAKNATLTAGQLEALTEALNRAAGVLEKAAM